MSDSSKTSNSSDTVDTVGGVRRVAELAGLRLDDGEVDRLAGELADILEHMDALREAATAGVDLPATAGSTPLRPDRRDPDRLAEGPGSQAPGWEDGFFTVPRLASHERESEEDGSDIGP